MTKYAIVDAQPTNWPGGGAIYIHADGCVLQWLGAAPVPGLTVLTEAEVFAACDQRGWERPDPDLDLTIPT